GTGNDGTTSAACGSSRGTASCVARRLERRKGGRRLSTVCFHPDEPDKRVVQGAVGDALVTDVLIAPRNVSTTSASVAGKRWAVSSKIVDKVYIRPVSATRDEMSSESHQLVETRGMSIAQLKGCAAPEFYGHAWLWQLDPAPACWSEHSPLRNKNEAKGFGGNPATSTACREGPGVEP